MTYSTIKSIHIQNCNLEASIKNVTRNATQGVLSKKTYWTKKASV